jgi:hypothetical protein
MYFCSSKIYWIFVLAEWPTNYSTNYETKYWCCWGMSKSWGKCSSIWNWTQYLLQFLLRVINLNWYICVCSLGNWIHFSGHWKEIPQCTSSVLYMYLTLKCGIIFQRIVSGRFTNHKTFISSSTLRTQSHYRRLLNVKSSLKECCFEKWFQGPYSGELEDTCHILKEFSLTGLQWSSEWGV